ncbi:MAG: acetate--CoA ligase [Actinobacteria bacterium]|nr:acetate--CoA ligase [Actinomycetota bacterium]
MAFEYINKKGDRKPKLIPNIEDYNDFVDQFDWSDVYEEISWLPGGGLNNAFVCIDKHVLEGNGQKLAMIWEGKNGEEEQYTFEEMKSQTDKFANVLKSIGVEKGDRVFVFMDRLPECYFSVFGGLKIGAIVGPLFSAFGPEPVKDRMSDSGAKVLITQPELRKKISGILTELPDLKKIIVVNKNGREENPLVGSDLSYEELMSHAEPIESIENTSQYDYSIMHYTSGTTGKPKGALHRHQSIIQQFATGRWALDFKPDDIYWCTADPGWVTGTSYGMFAPWSSGITQVIYEGGFSATKWYGVIEKYSVNIWYTAPTAIRMLMKAGGKPIQDRDLTSLRFIASVGEPLNPEAVVWGNENYEMPIHDNWWQTETGAIMCANLSSMQIRPGSMGRPMPGIELAILDKDFKKLPANEPGILAVKPGWPSQFFAYWKNDERYNSRFKRGWYITGDEAYMDEDGYFWFQGRSDDVINTAGHLVSPFEVESTLIEHEAVAEAGVIGIPDKLAMEVVKAFVSLNTDYEWSKDLRRDLMRFCREKLSAGIAPRDIEYVDSMPKTRSGKIMRRLLKARELGLPEGDTSTLEED